MKIRTIPIVTILIGFIQLSSCRRMPAVVWPTESMSNLRLTHLAYHSDTDQLYIGATNNIYHLQGETLEQLNTATTGPFDETTDDENTVLIVNKTSTGSVFITTCSSTKSYCAMRNITDVREIVEELTPAVSTPNATVLTLVKNHRRKVDYTFVACPHSGQPIRSTDACSQPGILWTTYDRGQNVKKEIKFKASSDTDIVTEKFIGSSVIANFRIFFSIQRNTNTNQKQSRLAQICQYHRDESQNARTYADMVLKCGDFTILTDVEEYEVDDEHLFITTFTDEAGERSGICVYSFAEIKIKLKENIRRCYSGNKVGGRDDYIHGEDSRCNTAATVSLTDKDEDYFLCNKDRFPLYFSVIGEDSLNKVPILRYQLLLTAVVVTLVDTDLVAFLGTDHGDVRKAVVYPLEDARTLDDITMVANKERINSDMFIDEKKESIYAMTSFKVAKIPVQTCSDHTTCRSCLSDRDPYCGWCVLESRCTTNSSCNATWIPAAPENTTCLRMTITPRDIELPVQSSESVEIKLSHPLPELQSGRCVFHFQEVIGNKRFIVRLGNSSAIHRGSDCDLFSCRMPDMIPVINRIKGSANIMVSILGEFSNRPLAVKTFNVYSCQTFDSCSSCTKSSCNWCTYDNKCVTDREPCIHVSDVSQNVSSVSDCPNMLRAAEKPSLMDGQHVLYLPDHESFDILIEGRNLPKPQAGLQYTCQIPGAASQSFSANWTTQSQVTCKIKKELYQLIAGRQQSSIQLMWGNKTVDGVPIPVVLYKCEDLVQPRHNCDKCKSFATLKPYYQCHWCNNQCVYSKIPCQSNGETRTCPNPAIREVSPLKIYMKTQKLDITIKGINLGSTFNETRDSVTIGNQTCEAQEQYFVPSEEISCKLEGPGVESQAELTLALPGREPVTFHSKILFMNPNITSIFPNRGPLAGGTEVTLYGTELDLGKQQGALIGNKACKFISIAPSQMVCKTTESATSTTLPVSMVIDRRRIPVHSSYSYVDDPVISSINPRKSFNGGGRRLTVSGTNLDVIQKPKIFTWNLENGHQSTCVDCERDDVMQVIYCKTPLYPTPASNAMRRKRRKREMDTKKETWLIGFEMDDVQSVRDLPENLARLIYVENPEVKLLPPHKQYSKILIIKGERMGVAASVSDVNVHIGQDNCNITKFTNETIQCTPPTSKPESNQTAQTSANAVPVQVLIGFIKYDAGHLDYRTQVKHLPLPTEERTKEYIIAGTVGGILFLAVCVLVIVMIVILRKKKFTAKENERLMLQMDKLEATVYDQCREEFAALQTTMSDLTSDLEGGNILFRDYDVYACKVLFTDVNHPALAAPIIMNDRLVPGLDAFKGLLKNKDFLLMFIRTLEQQKQSFTMPDRSNFASLLMVIHSDNTEFVTDIMKALLNDLVDKTVAEQRTKLLLRRSECVVEKLVTHWLSICLYHYLKECTGSALFILYKAIKVQVEKGPLDYMTGCAKYTLSEAKLFTAGDAEINAKPLTLHVHHYDYISDKYHSVTVQCLACDTITQTKSKMLDIIYKNIPYSQRPNVHKTVLEIKESDGTTRMVHDEDASNEKDGIWKRLNTLFHYNVEDGAKMELTVSKEKDIAMLSDSASPESFIVGSVKRSKSVMRTVSGSNFWHLTKQHKEDEMHMSSEIFFPRLLNTKGTLQTYIDDLFTEMLRVGEEPPLIIKYLFDFLDSAAARHGLTDPDVLHTWKCNSLLLRFWVNLIKNPEFVFDIHKPQIVDSCLSVITQTLMDSCSTAALRLGKDSPSNKLLFAKDIPRYKDSVKSFFQEIHDKPSISDQDLNCYLTENVSQKFGGRLHTSSALLEVYKYASKYKDEIIAELRALEIPAGAHSAQNQDTPLLLKLQHVYTLMAACNTTSELEVSGSAKTRKSN